MTQVDEKGHEGNTAAVSQHIYVQGNMVKTRQEFLLTTVIIAYLEHYVILVQQSCLVLLFTSNIIILVQLWVADEGRTIEWSYLPRKIVRRKRLSFRGHGDCILSY